MTSVEVPGLPPSSPPDHACRHPERQTFRKKESTRIRGRGHDGLVDLNCVRTNMSKSVSISETFVDLAANAIYSHKSAGHNALAIAFVVAYEDSPVIVSVVDISRKL